MIDKDANRFYCDIYQIWYALSQSNRLNHFRFIQFGRGYAQLRNANVTLDKQKLFFYHLSLSFITREISRYEADNLVSSSFISIINLKLTWIYEIEHSTTHLVLDGKTTSMYLYMKVKLEEKILFSLSFGECWVFVVWLLFHIETKTSQLEGLKYLSTKRNKCCVDQKVKFKLQVLDYKSFYVLNKHGDIRRCIIQYYGRKSNPLANQQL